jgi:hypothetical protein
LIDPAYVSLQPPHGQVDPDAPNPLAARLRLDVAYPTSNDALALRSRGIIQFGLLLLVATPLARVDRQDDIDPRPDAGCTVDGNVTVTKPNDFPDNGRPESCTVYGMPLGVNANRQFATIQPNPTAVRAIIDFHSLSL